MRLEKHEKWATQNLPAHKELKRVIQGSNQIKIKTRIHTCPKKKGGLKERGFQSIIRENRILEDNLVSLFSYLPR